MKITFCGDMSPTVDNMELFRQGDCQALFGDTLPLYRQADYAVVNLEVALTDQETPIRKIGPPLAATPNTARVLAEAGFTHCALSNNHIFDMGKPGVTDTLAALEQAGLGHTGFGMNEADAQKDLVLEKEGKTLCVIAVCEHEYSYATEDRMGARAFDPFDTPLQVRAAKERYDRVVVLYHGGKEQCRYPSPRLRKACHAMAKSGADLVLCQHSHTIGCYEQIDGCHIVYGQGNFHFVKDAYLEKYPDWHEGLVAVYDADENQLELVPVIGEKGCIRKASQQEADRILADMAKRNESLADGSWKDGWHAFCVAHKDMYTATVGKAYSAEGTDYSKEKFAHYLDCEAHQDVWRELFQTYNLTENK